MYVTRNDLMLWRMRNKSNYGVLRRHWRVIKPITFLFSIFFKAKISTLKAEISLLKDECDFLKKGIEKMKSVVPTAVSQVHADPTVSDSSGLCFMLHCYLFLLEELCCFGVNKLMLSSYLSQFYFTKGLQLKSRYLHLPWEIDMLPSWN